MIKRRDMHSSGFSLIEVIVIIAILAVVAGAMAPLAVRVIDSSCQDLTLKRQQAIYQAILGDPTTPGYGFLSDIGRLPGANLTELAVQGTLPLYSIQTCGVGMGWRGPYVLDGVNAAGQILDGWGTPMDLFNGQIRSAGPDHDMSTASDNLLYPTTPITVNNVNSSIVLEVFALDNSTGQPMYVPAGGQAIVYYAQNGLMQSLTMASPTGSYVFPTGGASLPQGIHAVTVTGDPPPPQSPVTNTIIIYSPGGGTVQQTVALR
jgi:hypothetical protein